MCGGGGRRGCSTGNEPASVRHTQPLSRPERCSVDGWESARREALTRRLSYHRIRSGLWETPPPKHTRTLPPAHTHTHAERGSRTKCHQGRPEGRLRKAAGHTPVSNKHSLLASWLPGEKFLRGGAQWTGAPTCSRAQLIGGVPGVWVIQSRTASAGQTRPHQTR